MKKKNVQTSTRKAFLGVFGYVSTKTLQRYAIFLRFSQNSQYCLQLEVPVEVSISKAPLSARGIFFVPKFVEKMRFFGFSDITPLTIFAILLHYSKLFETYKIATHFI